MIYKVIELDKNHQQSKCGQEGNKNYKQKFSLKWNILGHNGFFFFENKP